jgi:hypothetical protein
MGKCCCKAKKFRLGSKEQVKVALVHAVDNGNLRNVRKICQSALPISPYFANEGGFKIDEAIITI